MALSPIKAEDGYYVALFPMDYLNVTQTWGAGTLSHRNHQTDWVGTTHEYPYYACAPMRCYGITGSGYTWTTTEPVHTPSGLKYLSIWVAHDNNANRAHVGTVINAGTLLGKTGVRGYVTGDHLHLDVSFGQSVATAYDHLSGDVNPTEAFYITNSYRVVNLTANGITLHFQKWNEPSNYTLTVTGGTATRYSGAAGESVTITATIPSGYKFSHWTATSGTIANSNASSTTFTFGKSNASVTAHFLKIFTLRVVNGSASKTSGVAGETVKITARIPRDRVFTHWSISGNGSIANANDEVTNFTFGDSDCTVTANSRILNVASNSDVWNPYNFINHRNKY